LTTAWFDEQKRLTPDQMQTVTFPETRMGRRGYEQEPVNRFLRLVHAEFVRLVSERASLWQDVQQLRRRILTGEAAGDDRGEVLFTEADAHVHAVEILSTAQITADRYAADAPAHSDQVSEEARVLRAEILREAQEYSDKMLQDAHLKAREAAVRALNGAPPPQTDRERRAAQAELAYLRTYSGVYREHLRAYTEGVLRGIQEWERKEAASFQPITSFEETAFGTAEHWGVGQ
jgi:cell division septum initiation protein DivIVA